MLIGRITSAPRKMGKLAFVHLFSDGKYQQLFSKSDLSTWSKFISLSQGDIISCSGEMFVTKTGENTLRLLELNLLRKCELGLPDRISGVSVDKSRKNKHLALLSEIVSKERDLSYRDTILLRAKVLSSIRKFLDGRGFIEVQTPTLIENAFGCDAKPFKTEEYFLRIAPELELKKLIVGGFGGTGIYEIGKSFRNEGLSQRHNPEFTMLEFYLGGTAKDGLEIFKQLVSETVQNIFGTTTVRGIDWSKFVYANNPFIEEEAIQPTIMSDFTVEDSPLAKIGGDGRPERYEIYCGGMEIANIYSEQDDWRQQLEAFERQDVIDMDYIEALKYGLPPTWGAGLGVDRLLMLLTGRAIKEVL